MKYRVKADKDSSLYFIKWYGGSYPLFIIDDSLSWETQAKTFDTWQDANTVAQHFNGYIEEVQPDLFLVYWSSKEKKFIPRQENQFVKYDNIVESSLTEIDASKLALNLNIAYEFVMERN